MPKPRQIAAILDSTSPYQRKILFGLGVYMREVGNWGLYLEDQPVEKLPDLRRWRGDGVLLTFLNRGVVNAIGGLGIPIVGIEGNIGWYDPASRIPYFATDNRAIGRLGAEHLIGQGFIRLAYCGIPPTRFSGWSTSRAKAFAERARGAGLPCSVFTGHYIRARQWPDLQQELVAWLESLEKPIGIMAANDARARHLLEACHTAGLRVPEDVAVLGVDNDEVVCELTNPPLSSIEQGARALGYQAAALLDRLMDGKKSRSIRHLVKPNDVVMRRSTNILAITDPDVAAAVAFIRDHACDPISVSDVISVVQVSRSTLVTRFKAVMGRTIHAEIQRVQIEKARHMIATSDIPLKQIATLAGFAHINYLTTVFREYTGWTPAEYRRRSRI